MINYKEIPEFKKDFKALLKKFKTLNEDFEKIKKYVLETFYIQNTPTTAIVAIEGFCSEEYTSNKVRKFSSLSLKGKGSASGIRIIYIWEKSKKEITFIEIYFKADKENENRERLKNYISEHF